MSRSSSKLVARVTAEFAEKLKNQHVEPIEVKTSDAIYLGYPVRPIQPGDRFIRLCTCRGYVRDSYQYDRRQSWEIVDIDRNSVVRPATASLLTDSQFETLYAAA
jgi:hypothetical protein